MPKPLQKLDELLTTYGGLLMWAWRIILLPIFYFSFHAATLYLDSRYELKGESKAANEIMLKKMDSMDYGIGEKLDSLLQTNATNGEKFLQMERRLNRLEDSVFLRKTELSEFTATAIVRN